MAIFDLQTWASNNNNQTYSTAVSSSVKYKDLSTSCGLLITFSLIMLDYPKLFLSLSTWSIFLAGWVEGVILRYLYYKYFFTRGLLHGKKLWGGNMQGDMLLLLSLSTRSFPISHFPFPISHFPFPISHSHSHSHFPSPSPSASPIPVLVA